MFSVPRPRPTLAAVPVATILIAMLPGAAAVVTTGATAAVDPGVRWVPASSGAIPVFLWGATTNAGDNLGIVRVDFGGTGFSQTDLAALSTNTSASGVAVFRDNGTTDDSYDRNDPGVVPSSVLWPTPIRARLNFPAAAAVPGAATGSYEWAIVLRTSATVSHGDEIGSQLSTNNILYSDGTGQPGTAVRGGILKADTRPPAGFALTGPVSWWTSDTSPPATAQFIDPDSGLDPAQVAYRWSADGGGNWSGWVVIPAGFAAGTNTTSSVTTPPIPFGNDSASLNQVQVGVADTVGNTNRSPVYTIRVDAGAPAPWTGYNGTGWQRVQRPTLGVTVGDSVSGLNTASARYRFSTDTGGTWSGWAATTTIAPNGTTAPAVFSATGIPFDADSGTALRLQFEVTDSAGNLAASPAFAARVDSVAPGTWGSFSGTTWSTSQRPTLSINAGDSTSGADPATAKYRISMNDEVTWSTWMGANATGTAGTTAPVTLTATDVPFDADSRDLFRVQFALDDVAGNTGVSPVYPVQVDTTAPPGPTMQSEPPFTAGPTNNVSAKSVADAGAGGVEYRFELAADPGFAVVASTSVWGIDNATSFAGLEDGKTYYYRAAARDSLGFVSAPSAAVQSMQDLLPPAVSITRSPAIPSGRSGWDRDTVTVGWSASDTASGVDGLTVILDGVTSSAAGPLQFATDGIHTVAARATDRVGHAGEANLTVNVDGTPATVVIAPPPVPLTSVNLTFDASGSRDDASGLLRANWDFGDGTSVEGWTPAHRFERPGLYQIRVRIEDVAGNNATGNLSLLVRPSPGDDQPPVPRLASPPTSRPGVNITFDGSGSTDEDPSNLSYRWEFGDGTTGEGATATHAYAKAGHYDVVLTVTDGWGLSANASARVRVRVTAPGTTSTGPGGFAVLLLLGAVLAAALLLGVVAYRRRERAREVPPPSAKTVAPVAPVAGPAPPVVLAAIPVQGDPAGSLEARSSLEYIEGYVRLKVAVLNETPHPVLDASLLLVYDRDSLRLARIEPELAREGANVQLGNLLPGQKKTAAFYLDPLICQTSFVEATITYHTNEGVLRTAMMKKRPVDIACPIFYQPSEVNLAILRRAAAAAREHEVRTHPLPAGVSARAAYASARRLLEGRSVRFVRGMQQDQPGAFIEAWFYGKVQETQEELVVTVTAGESPPLLGIAIAGSNVAGITGLLAELAHNLPERLQSVQPEEFYEDLPPEHDWAAAADAASWAAPIPPPPPWFPVQGTAPRAPPPPPPPPPDS